MPPAVLSEDGGDEESSIALPSYGGVWNAENGVGPSTDDPEGLLIQQQQQQQQPPPRYSSMPEYPDWYNKEQQDCEVHSEERMPLRKSTTSTKRTRRRRTSDPAIMIGRNNSKQQQVRFESNNGVLLSNDNSGIRDSRSSSIYNDDSIFPTFHHHWLPDKYETEDGVTQQPPASQHWHHPKQSTPPPALRSWKRRVFLFLTEPATSIGSAIFFFVLIFAIAFMNIVMIMQTMTHWQYTPDDCITCGGDVVYVFEDDSISENSIFDSYDNNDPSGTPSYSDVPCVCPPTPYEWTNTVLKHLIYFFTVEWILRVVFFEPPQEQYAKHQRNGANETDRALFWQLWFSHISDATTILDALAIFPFYLEAADNTNGLMSLRLLRLFRVFQLLRLGQYNTTFLSLTSVLRQSMIYLKLLMVVLIFGAALFGSLMYWLEKGNWQYHHASASYRFMRLGVDGVTEEPSPFTSIPAAFWWFMVTATTVGYGYVNCCLLFCCVLTSKIHLNCCIACIITTRDVYPTSVAGKWVATCAMLTGVLVVAFPVSVFSDLWQKEVRKIAKERRILLPDDGSEIADDDEDSNGDGDYDNNDQDIVLAKSSADSCTNPGSEAEDSVYYGSRAKEFDTLVSNMSLPRLRYAPAAEKYIPPVCANNSSIRSGILQGHLGSDKVLDERDQTKTSSDKAKNTAIMIERDDLMEIMDRLESIRQNETRIRSLMKKYHL